MRSTQTDGFTGISTVKKNNIVVDILTKNFITYTKSYLFDPTAGIETLESDAERLNDSSSPRGALPSGIVTFNLLTYNIIIWYSENIQLKRCLLTCDWINC